MKTKTKNTIYFADFETLTFNSKEYQQLGLTDVYLWGLMNDKNDDFIYGCDISSFFNKILEDGKSKTIYFHNLTFDGNFIYKYLLKKYPKWYKDEYNNQNKQYNFWTLFRKDRKIYSIELKIKKRFEKITKIFAIRFLCSYNLIPSSIEALAPTFGLNKHNKDDIKWLIENKYIKDENNFYDLGGKWIFQNEKILKIYVNYLKNDIIVQKNAYLNFKSTIEGSIDAYSKKFKKRNINVQNILTTSSIVQKLVKNNIYNSKNNDVIKNFFLKNKNDYEFSRNFFYGGFVQFNKNYQNKFIEHGFYIDLNSSYPFSMTKLLPYGPLLKSIPNSKYYLTYVKIEMEFSIKTKYKNLICLKNMQKTAERYKSWGVGTYYFLEQEFKIYQKIYNIKIIKKETYYSKADFFLKDFIKNYYSLKQNAENVGMRNTYKLLLNACYGSFGKKALYPTEMFIPLKFYEYLKKTKNETNYAYITEMKQVKHFKNEYWKQLDLKLIAVDDLEKELKLKKYPNLLVGATITAYSRILLLETILKLGVENFIYSDTDSIFFRWNRSKEELEKIIKLDDNELGAWKIEFEFIKGKILGAKRYVLEDKVGKIKYATAGIKKLKFKNFEEVDKVLNTGVNIENARFEICEDDNGIYFKWKTITMKEGNN